MAKFRFTLLAVLQQRERIEQERQRAVAVLESERLDLEGRIRRYQQEMLAERASQRQHLGTGDVNAARFQAAAALRLDASAQRSVLQLAGIYKRLESARAELIEAMQARKAVELLRERRYEEWKRDEQRRDAAAVDEIAIMRAGRKEGHK